MMFETSCFREDLFAMRKIYESGGLGKIVYSEGEYFHYMSEPIDSYQGLEDRIAASVVSYPFKCLLYWRA